MAISRRELLQGAAAFTTIPGWGHLSAWATSQGGQAVAKPSHGITLNPKSLFARGKPDVYSSNQLKWIGMPIGGLCCGQLYLGGDGKLWHWDLWTQPDGWDMNGLSSGTHYANPMVPKSPIECSFALFCGGEPFAIDSKDFKNVTFRGEYPIARVTFSDPRRPVEVELEAFSPFIPLNTDDSSLPLTVLRYTVKNRTKDAIDLAILGAIENPVGVVSKAPIDRINRATKNALICEGKPFPRPATPEPRPAHPLQEWKGDTYGNWKVDGTAFGSGPYKVKDLSEWYRAADPVGTAFVNTHNGHNGENSPQADDHVGKLTSPEFVVDRNFISFRIGGGNHPGKTCLNLLIQGKVVRTATGTNSLKLRAVNFDVSDFQGQTATIEIVDNERGGWGHISVDRIDLTDVPSEELDVTELADFGQLALHLSGPNVVVQTKDPTFAAESQPAEVHQASLGGVAGGVKLAPGASHTFEFVLAWYFPNYGKVGGSFAEITDIRKLKKHYAKRFRGVEDVLAYFAKNRKRLVSDTQLWVKTWYDSTLPYWFLDRTMISVDCLATATAHRFDNGRFYGWEGVYCCPGTCQHVWNYAQSSARLFPELERTTRATVDFGLSWRPDGAIDYRGESGQHIAHDGLAGTIVRTYREHTMTQDSAWLKAIWPRVKKTVERLIQEDPNQDGLLEAEQYNTLDASWFGKISWISSLYMAALRAGAAMARDMGEPAVAEAWEKIVVRGAKSITDATFNGEFYAMVRDPAHPRAPGSGPGCHIDQVLGDSWLLQMGLEPALPKEQVRSALTHLFNNNFVADAGSYMTAMQADIKGGRWYAMPGEPGMLMTTWPRGGAKDAKGEGNPDWMVGYFNECMNGFEYQAAAHFIAEDMVAEGFALVQALHQRYTPDKRNPYNEIECSDHYSRSMAAYGAFITTCGFAHHGPNKTIAFTPKVNPSNFRAAFTCATGWGTYSQVIGPKKLTATLEARYGTLDLREIELELTAFEPKTATVNGKPAKVSRVENEVRVTLPSGKMTRIVVELTG